ncbi:hypothetical protein BG004_005816 [Podila humilis]|nr:hypothetical protein BG004_005816 [Podila humilis]
MPATSVSAWLMLASLMASTFVLAQTPVPVIGPAFAKSSSPSKLYILGGSANKNNIGQFFSLDLTVPWNATHPSWQQLADGPVQSVFPAVFSGDGKTMAAFHTGGSTFSFRYNVATNSWKQSSVIASNTDFQGVGAVADPNTGLVYLPGSYTDPSRNSMNIYNLESDTMVQVALPPASTIFPNRAYYSGVWSQKRMSAIFFGGYNSTLKLLPDGYNMVTEFIPAAGTWANLLHDNSEVHCQHTNGEVSIDDDGSLVIVYGGRPYNNVYSGEVFILDTVAKSWRQGTPGPVRIYTTCTIAGDQLLIWGGEDQSTAAPSNIFIYNIATNTWVTQYTPPASYLAPKPTPSLESSGSSSPNAGIIAGGVVGALAVICALVLFLVFRRRRAAADRAGSNAESRHMMNTDSSSSTVPQCTREDDEIQQMRNRLQNQQEQLELQRRLLQLQQEQQQLNMSHQAYPYQSTTLYSGPGMAGPVYVFSQAPITSDSPEAYKYVAAPGSAPSGYMDEGSAYSELPRHTPVVTPMVYSPPVVTVANVHVPVTTMTTSQPPVVADNKPENLFWDEQRVPGNPHTIIE